MADKPAKKSAPKKDDEDIASVAGGIIFGDKQPVKGGNVYTTVSGSYIGGDVNVGGGTFIGRDQNISVSMDDGSIRRAFMAANEAIANRSNTSDDLKGDLQAEVRDLEAHWREKTTNPEEDFISRRTRNIARMAPDILDVIITTLANPVAGFALILKKSAEKAKESASQSS